MVGKQVSSGPSVPAPSRRATAKLFLLGAALACVGFSLPGQGRAVVSGRMNEHFSALPGFLPTGGGTLLSGNPYYLFAMSRDQQLFYKAYSDYTDFDGDNVPEVGYQHDIDYYGYFDPHKCYAYSTSEDRFQPQGFSDYSGDQYSKYCNGSQWSGNFLNWASTIRIDVVRKAIYGGKRSTDTATLTVLESASVPQDSHAFVKYYEGSDLNQLTPYSFSSVTFCRVNLVQPLFDYTKVTYASQGSESLPLLRVVEGDYRLWAANEGLQCTTHDGTYSQGEDLQTGAIRQVKTRLVPFLYPDSTSRPGSSGVIANGDIQEGRLRHVVRVEVCDQAVNSSRPGGIDQESCAFASGVTSPYKPTGILQRYHPEGARYALVTGSYSNNLRGGVLRRRFSDDLTEYDADGLKASSIGAEGSIVHTLDSLRVFGIRWQSGGFHYERWTGSDRNLVDNFCNSLSAVVRNGGGFSGDCPSWGNPFGEIYAEAVNYAIGGTANSAFQADDASLAEAGQFLATLQETAWAGNADILGDSARDLECSPVNIVAFNTSNIDHDADQLVGLSGDITISRSDMETMTNTIGRVEKVDGEDMLVGASDSTNGNYTCTAKKIGSLSAVRGLCPGWVSGEGSYLSAGLAAHVHLKDLHTRDAEQTISTYVLNLTPDLPIIRIPRGDPDTLPPGEAGLAAEITPAYWQLRNPIGGANRDTGTQSGGRNPWFVPGVGQLVDFKVLQRHEEITVCPPDPEPAPSGTPEEYEPFCYMIRGNTELNASLSSGTLWGGRYMVVWEDSVAGGDYDQDILGTIEYIFDEANDKLLVATHLLDESVSGDAQHLFGFVLAGSKDMDGFHAYSGHHDGTYFMPGNDDPARTRAQQGRYIPAYADPANRPSDGNSGFWGYRAVPKDKEIGLDRTNLEPRFWAPVEHTTASFDSGYLRLGANYASVDYSMQFGQFNFLTPVTEVLGGGGTIVADPGSADRGCQYSGFAEGNLLGLTPTDTARLTERSLAKSRKMQDYLDLTRYWMMYTLACSSSPGNCEIGAGTNDRNDGLELIGVTRTEGDMYYNALKVPSCGWPMPRTSAYLETVKPGGLNLTQWQTRPTPPLTCYPQSAVGEDFFFRADGTIVDSTDFTNARNDNCVFQRLAEEDLLVPQLQSTRVWHIFDLQDTYESPYLESPLYYAAKWGGFRDTNGDNEANLVSEWDSYINTTGAVGSDGLPDNYYEITDPSQLENALRRIILQGGIEQRTGSGTAAAVLANDRRGLGGIYQAYFEVERESDDVTVDWIGTVYALFIDPNGFLREDGNQNGQLDGYMTDQVVQVFFDNGQGDTRLRRFISSGSDTYQPAGDTEHPLEDLKPLWNARERLSALSDTAVTAQRTYGQDAVGGRHILTWVDSDLDRTVDSTEIVDFNDTGGGLRASYRFMDVESEECAEEVINYLRGRDGGNAADCMHVSDLRNRTFDYDKDGILETMRLGDIAHSAPVAVGAPAATYDLLSGDVNYAAFRRQYADRRQVIYVGANDGMLHAFNAGFYDVGTGAFGATPPAGISGTAHPLGSELWAYVPGNLLPRLKYYMQGGLGAYEHMFYVDGIPEVFDARVFPNDAVHPGGWGTLMVVGFRLGGNPDNPNDGGRYGTLNDYRVDTRGDGLCGAGADHSDDIPFKSAFVVLDITDPEQPPTVIAELSPINNASVVLGTDGCNQVPAGGLQFATSGVGVVPISTALQSLGKPSSEEWYVMVGTGTADLQQLTPPAQPQAVTPHVYIYDLEELVNGGDPNASGALTSVALPEADGEFVGQFINSDFDLDLKAEVSYFGTIGGVAADRGRLYRVHIGERSSPSSWDFNVMLDARQPISTEPTITLDARNTSWVLFGTGRFLTDADNRSETTQTLYGIRDANPWDVSTRGSTLYRVTKDPATIGQAGSVSTCALLNVSGAVVSSAGVDLDGNGTAEYNSVSLLLAKTRGLNDLSGYGSSNGVSGQYYCGWFRDYPAAVSQPSQRSITTSRLLENVLFNSSYAPPGAPLVPGAFIPSSVSVTPTVVSSCVPQLGDSFLFGLDWRVGVAPESVLFGTVGCGNCPGGVTEMYAPAARLGKGLPSTPSLHIGQPGEHVPGKVTAVLQQSTGETTTVESAATLLLSTEISWREYLVE